LGKRIRGLSECSFNPIAGAIGSFVDASDGMVGTT
jgi:hypothetical protein